MMKDEDYQFWRSIKYVEPGNTRGIDVATLRKSREPTLRDGLTWMVWPARSTQKLIHNEKIRFYGATGKECLDKFYYYMMGFIHSNERMVKKVSDPEELNKVKLGAGAFACNEYGDYPDEFMKSLGI